MPPRQVQIVATVILKMKYQILRHSATNTLACYMHSGGSPSCNKQPFKPCQGAKPTLVSHKCMRKGPALSLLCGEGHTLRGLYRTCTVVVQSRHASECGTLKQTRDMHLAKMLEQHIALEGCQRKMNISASQELLTACSSCPMCVECIIEHQGGRSCIHATSRT